MPCNLSWIQQNRRLLFPACAEILRGSCRRTGSLADYLRERPGTRLVYLSTANVFDALNETPHIETDPPAGAERVRLL